MTEIQTHNHETPAEDSMAAFIERVRLQTETFGSRLHHLFSTEGNSNEFQDALEDVVWEICTQIPEYEENTKRLQSGLRGSEAEKISVRQREIADEVRQMVLLESRIGTDEAGSDVQIARETIAKRLEGFDVAHAGSDDILRHLGILHEDENGGATFTYPEELLPEGVNKKWGAYISSVRRHIDMGKKVLAGEEEAAMLGEADKARKFAHDAITTDLHEILGLSQIDEVAPPEGSDRPPEKWDYKSTRNLVAKMRDAKFIDEPTSESEITARALQQSIGAAVLSKLSDRTSPTRR